MSEIQFDGERSRASKDGGRPIRWDCNLTVKRVADGMSFEIYESHEGGGIDLSFEDVRRLIDFLEGQLRGI